MWSASNNEELHDTIIIMKANVQGVTSMLFEGHNFFLRGIM